MATANDSPDVAVIGAGPAGLGAAIRLRRLGADRVVVLDREAEAGGIPRHCGHPPFGMRELKRVLTGPGYARRLVAKARDAGVDIRCRHTVVALRPGGELRVSTPEGLTTLHPRRVILATGVRETPRSARLVGGDRPLGVLTTGALQSMAYLKGLVPFHHPVIVGTELVSFSALLTCRHAGIRPVAMLEPKERITARWPAELLPRLMAVPVRLRASVASILGEERVRAVEVEDRDGAREILECDGVLFTGEFVPEAALVRDSELALCPASGGPEVDQFGRCSDPAYFAAGNLLRPVETAGWCHREGADVAANVMADLHGSLAPPQPNARLRVHPPLKLVMPQRLARPAVGGWPYLQLRLAQPIAGELRVESHGKCVYRKRIAARPERRVLVPVSSLALDPEADELSIYVQTGARAPGEYPEHNKTTVSL